MGLGLRLQFCLPLCLLPFSAAGAGSGGGVQSDCVLASKGGKGAVREGHGLSTFSVPGSCADTAKGSESPAA